MSDGATRAHPPPADRPWIKAYPLGVPAEIATPRYRLLGDAAPDLAARRGDAEAFTTIMPNGMVGRLSFNEVDRLSDAFAAYLRECLRLEAGSRIAVQMPNGLAYPVVTFGVFKAGCILVNVNPLYTPAEMAHVFEDAKVSAIVMIDMLADRLANAMKESPIRHIILSQASSLFPAHKRLIVGLVQKYIRKQIPRPAFAAASLRQALAMGAREIGAGANVRAYVAGLEPSAIACLQYTGGTTGVCKAAMLTHRNLVCNVAQFLALVGDAVDESDHVLTALPLYHIFAFTGNMLGFFFRGAHNVLIPSPRPLTNLRRAFASQPITFITGVNTLFNGLLNEPWFRDHPPRALRLSVAGGMAMQAAVAKRWAETTRTPLIQGYGLSEASPVLTVNPPLRPKPDSIGVAVPATEIKCVDDDGREAPIGKPGELIARGPQIMAGYWNQPEETANALRDGWLYTGDIATEDEEGYFTIIDRRKDMILVSGFNVFPNEIEAVLAQLPAVKECAVVGVPDDCTGEAVKAFIVPRDPSLDVATVRDFCKTQLTAYKVPKFVAFREDLPKSNVGKILRRELRREAFAQQGAQQP